MPYPAGKNRTSEEIDVVAAHDTDIGKVRKEMIKYHPFKNLEPNMWNNVPIPVAHALTHTFEHIVNNDECMYDFMVMTNSRLQKL